MLLFSLVGDVAPLFAIKQPTVPASCKEIPFIETNPEPLLTFQENKRGFMLFRRPIMDPVYPNTIPAKYERIDNLTGFATPGELEPITFSMYPIRELKNLKVRISSLKSDKGEIPASNITIRLATYWNIGFPRYTTQSTYRRTPELLEAVTQHTSQAKECQRYWITIDVPTDAKQGTYHGNITIHDDELKDVINVPVSFKVLGFKLKKDPNKHYSAYYYMRNRSQYDGRSEKWSKQTSENEYKAMVKYGLDVAPTLYLRCYDKARKIFSIQGPKEIERMLKSGLKGPIPLAAGNGIEQVYLRMTPGGQRRPHWKITKMPSPEFYIELTKMFKEFEKMRKAKGWPEFVCCPLDEVAPSHKEFGRKIYKAVQNSGIRTYITKNPKSADAIDYENCVDVWCSQPYSTPYEKIIKQKKYEYWSYPNHNAGEIKDRRVMCKGGRMTYGFGLWRSGFTTLIPWHWSWTPKAPSQFNYLGGTRSGCGQRITEKGEVIPAIYWECFREGIDDGRYIYTLQQAIYERKNSTNIDCKLTLKNAKKVLQKIWDDIVVQEKYLATGMWTSSEFNARRFLIAQSIKELLKYPTTNNGTAPSVTVANTTSTSSNSENIIIEEGLKNGNIESLNITGDINNWKNLTQEGKRVKSDDSAFRWIVKVDHKLNNVGKKSKYIIGWPRIRQYLKTPLNFNHYDYLIFHLKVDSNRDEVKDDTTPVGLTITSNKFFEKTYDLGGRQRVWIPIKLSIKDLIDQVGLGKKPWQEIKMIQIFIAEKNYADGTELNIDIGKIELLKFKKPIISNIKVPEYIILPSKFILFKIATFGINNKNKSNYKIKISLYNQNKKMILSTTDRLVSNQTTITLETSKLKPGKYLYKACIIDEKNRVLSEKFATINLLQ